MTTDTTTGIKLQLRTRLLTFAPLSGAALPDVIGVTTSGAGIDGKLYWIQPTDNIAGVYGVMALKNRRSIPDIPEGWQAELEIMWFGRPRSVQTTATVELAADVSEQAMHRYRENGIWCIGTARSPMPLFQAPADRDVVQVMVTFTLRIYADYLTQYADT